MNKNAKIHIAGHTGLAAVSLVLLLCAASAPAAEPSAILAVFELQDATGKLGRAAREQLTDYLATRLGERGAFQVIPREDLKRRLRDAKKDSYRACYDQSCQIELGRELAATASVSARLTRLGKSCQLSVSLYDLRKATSTSSATLRTGCGLEELADAIDRAVVQLGGAEPAGGYRLVAPAGKGKAPAGQPASPCLGGRVLVANHCCWPGQDWGETQQRCMGRPACPDATTRLGDDCKPGCRAGMALVSGHCCWPGQDWGAGTGKCIGEAACPKGFKTLPDKLGCQCVCEEAVSGAWKLELGGVAYRLWSTENFGSFVRVRLATYPQKYRYLWYTCSVPAGGSEFTCKPEAANLGNKRPAKPWDGENLVEDPALWDRICDFQETGMSCFSLDNPCRSPMTIPRLAITARPSCDEVEELAVSLDGVTAVAVRSDGSNQAEAERALRADMDQQREALYVALGAGGKFFDELRSLRCVLVWQFSEAGKQKSDRTTSWWTHRGQVRVQRNEGEPITKAAQYDPESRKWLDGSVRNRPRPSVEIGAFFGSFLQGVQPHDGVIHYSSSGRGELTLDALGRPARYVHRDSYCDDGSRPLKATFTEEFADYKTVPGSTLVLPSSIKHSYRDTAGVSKDAELKVECVANESFPDSLFQ